ncbi:hypothetical protein KR018_003295 [Drosophila ironensis]|nr:hypothetical protein KR018_003295 [Drosophila ironensis]
MSDEEEESVSEGFSASEDEWKPSKDARGGESSDDDDSDFDEVQAAGAGGPGAPPSSGRSSAGPGKRRDQKQASGIKGSSVKKRKPSGQSLRSKLYNKYRPPPKTFPTSPSQQQNSPAASGSGSGSKNARTPNESGARGDQQEAADSSSSESSVDDYLVNPADLDLQSTFFAPGQSKEKSPAPAPQFDCNAGLANLSDSGSGSEDNNDSSVEDKAGGAFDFRGLLENANSLERTRDALAKRHHAATPPRSQTATMDVNALLALGENQNYEEQEERREPQTGPRRRGEAGGVAAKAAGAEAMEGPPPPMEGPPRLSKTKSTRIKRHTKTRPVSTVVANAGDTDDSDFEEVADAELESEFDEDASPNISGDLEIHVGLPQRPTKEQKTQHELAMALNRRINRNIKDRQLLLHKASLMCQLARSMKYNKLLSESDVLMQAALKLLPSKNSYPTDRGVELKYLQSFVTWFKTAIKLLSPNLYSEQSTASKEAIVNSLLEQIKRKEARCKQDMIFIFIVLARGMGMHCRLIGNLQPLPLRPSASDLIPIKLKPEGGKNKSQTMESESEESESDAEPKKHKKAKAKPHAEKPREPTKRSSEKAATKSESSDKKSSDKNVKKTTNSSASSGRKEAEKIAKKETSKSVSSTRKDPVKNETSLSGKLPKKEEESPKSKTKSSKLTLSSKLASKGASKSDRSSDTSFEEKPSTSRAAAHTFQVESRSKPQLSLLKRVTTQKITESSEGKRPKLAPLDAFSPVAGRTRRAQAKPKAEVDVDVHVDVEGRQSLFSPVGSPVLPKLVLPKGKIQNGNQKIPEKATKPLTSQEKQPVETRARSKSPKVRISAAFMGAAAPELIPDPAPPAGIRKNEKIPDNKARISPTFLGQAAPARQLRTRQQKASSLAIPQLDGADDAPLPKKRPKLEKQPKSQDSDNVFEPAKPVKKAPVLPKSVQNLRKDRRVLSTDDEGGQKPKRRLEASDMWVEVWSEVEEQWICIDLFKGKLHCVDTIRRNASPGLAYVFAFQDDQSLKDVTARYCASWSTTVRKSRVEKAWLDETIAPYLGRTTKRDMREDEQLRRIHADKPLPKSIAEFKDHPLYVLQRHLLKFQALYPPDAPTLGFIRGEPIYSRDCVHVLHSREIWLKSARVVKLGEQPYKVVKARPKWDKLTRSVIKDQPLEIFGYWQTQDYEPPTAENGIVPRNAYGNVELFKACMLPKKTVHLRLPGLMRVCKKLNIDCANAVIGFDFHQGACHPMYDGFVVCEEFGEVVTAAWEEDQQEQARKEQAKYEERVYGNWKKLIKGLIIRERLKKKYNF